MRTWLFAFHAHSLKGYNADQYSGAFAALSLMFLKRPCLRVERFVNDFDALTEPIFDS